MPYDFDSYGKIPVEVGHTLFPMGIRQEGVHCRLVLRETQDFLCANSALRF